jgi:hypothetical protein
VSLQDRIGGVLRGLLERRDRVARALLRQQREAEQVQRVRMLRPAAEHLARDAFSLVRALVLDSGHPLTEGAVVGGRGSIRVVVGLSSPSSCHCRPLLMATCPGLGYDSISRASLQEFVI